MAKKGRPRKVGRPKGKSKAKKSNTTQDGGRLFDGTSLRRANKWLKDTKAISKIASAIGGPIGTPIAAISSHYGYGQNGGRSIGTAQYRPVLGRI